MKIIREQKCSEKPTSTALGFFDGIHLGHRAVISEAVQYAKKNNLVSTVFTMSESPRSIISQKKINGIITDEEKIAVLENMGVQQVYILDFQDIMNLSAEDFFNKIIYDCFNAKHIVCGFNYHFGKGRSGDGAVLRKMCEKKHITMAEKGQVSYNGGSISSTRIRQSIADGDIVSVNAMLGREYGFNLPVIHGRQLGRKMGTPTINQKFPSGLVQPLFGVYVSAVTVKDKCFCGVTNIGIKPTVYSDDVLIETWMPDYIGEDLYDENIDVRLIAHIRAERKFDGIDSLKDEIIKNGTQAKKIFENYMKGR